MTTKEYTVIPYLLKDVSINISEMELKHKLSNATARLDTIVREEFGEGATIVSHSMSRHETTLLLSLLIQYVGTQKLQANVSRNDK